MFSFLLFLVFFSGMGSMSVAAGSGLKQGFIHQESWVMKAEVIRKFKELVDAGTIREALRAQCIM
ncbi:MAG: hypothetical protein MJ202_10190 [Lentisphaeria bacterium]|nr:hypothetical protein [Lentisphaeria bacterium]